LEGVTLPYTFISDIHVSQSTHQINLMGAFLYRLERNGSPNLFSGEPAAAPRYIDIK
jgi:hypothetical protein